MHLQFISDGSGKTTGVFIPIEEWNALKLKFKGLEDDVEVPEWHKSIVAERNVEYAKKPKQADDFDTALDDIEKEL